MWLNNYKGKVWLYKIVQKQKKVKRYKKKEENKNKNHKVNNSKLLLVLKAKLNVYLLKINKCHWLW